MSFQTILSDKVFSDFDFSDLQTMFMTAKVLIIKEIVKYLFFGFDMDF